MKHETNNAGRHTPGSLQRLGSSGAITAAALHKRGYRLGDGCYYKTRRVTGRPHQRCTVQVALDRRYSIADLVAIEYGPDGRTENRSDRATTMSEVAGWETFAYCK